MQILKNQLITKQHAHHRKLHRPKNTISKKTVLITNTLACINICRSVEHFNA